MTKREELIKIQKWAFLFWRQDTHEETLEEAWKKYEEHYYAQQYYNEKKWPLPNMLRQASLATYNSYIPWQYMVKIAIEKNVSKDTLREVLAICNELAYDDVFDGNRDDHVYQYLTDEQIDEIDMIDFISWDFEWEW